MHEAINKKQLEGSLGKTENPRGLEATQKLVWDVLSQRHNNTQANLQAHSEQGLKEKDTIFLHLSNSNIPFSPEPSSTSDFLFYDSARGSGIKDDKSKRYKSTDTEKFPITLIRGGTV